MRKALKLEIINQINASDFSHADELKRYLNDYPNKCKFIGKRHKKGIKCKDYAKVTEILLKSFENNEDKKEAYQDYLTLHNNIIKTPESVVNGCTISCKIGKDYFTFCVLYIDNVGVVGCVVARLFEQDILNRFEAINKV
jgi:hypothetical protein